MKSKFPWVVGTALVVWLVIQLQRPKWIDDLLLRGYAGDHLDSAKNELHASQVATEHEIPLGWVLYLKKSGVPDEHLDKVVARIEAKMKQLGKPMDTQPETLKEYKYNVLSGLSGVL